MDGCLFEGGRLFEEGAYFNNFPYGVGAYPSGVLIRGFTVMIFNLAMASLKPSFKLSLDHISNNELISGMLMKTS